MQHETVGAIVTQEVEILRGAAATHDRRQGQHKAATARGIGRSGGGDDEFLGRTQIIGQIRRNDGQHAGGAACQRAGKSQCGGGGGAFGQLHTACARISQGSDRK